MSGFETIVNSTAGVGVFNGSCMNDNNSSSGARYSSMWTDVCLSVAFIVAGGLANGAVIWVLGFQMKRSGFLTYVLNLSVADFFFCVLLATQIPMYLAKNAYMYGLVLCRIEQYVTRVFYYAGTLLVASICLERCLAIRHPIWHKCRRPKSTPAITCAVAWSISLLLALTTPINLEMVDFGTKMGLRCYVKEMKAVKLISTLELILVFLLPLCMILTCSSFIARQLASESKAGTRRCQANRTVCMTALLFLVCWTPFQLSQYTILIQLMFLPQNMQLLSIASTIASYTSYLLYCHSCLNPFIYVLMGRSLKKKILHSLPSLKSSFERAFNEGNGEAATAEVSRTLARSSCSASLKQII
ncbi:fMet-Leu-Phe receptor-like [Amia ocellicauda]|uniref:fMet-Leu-Phe receptor-like n=1 Tax=Amia ocellicauda TaxID=2972642 RepID=UPI003464D544